MIERQHGLRKRIVMSACLPLLRHPLRGLQLHEHVQFGERVQRLGISRVKPVQAVRFLEGRVPRAHHPLFHRNVVCCRNLRHFLKWRRPRGGRGEPGRSARVNYAVNWEIFIRPQDPLHDLLRAIRPRRMHFELRILPGNPARVPRYYRWSNDCDSDLRYHCHGLYLDISLCLLHLHVDYLR